MMGDQAEKKLSGRILSLLESKYRVYSETLKGILYGLTVHEMHLEIKKEKSEINHLFMLVVFGDLIGLPLLPPYYTMRLLPYILPDLESWKTSLLRERDLTDLATVDL
jgi:hypothetical protein